jgi:CHAT domain-containing protein
MAALPRHEVVHLACHGQSAWDMRAGSKLLLHDHNENPLTISALSRLRLTGAELAYLGACSTTSTHPSLVNEAVHITAAFQIAGYRNVIGTLWSINDALATWTAHTVYSLLTKDGGLDTTQAAHALHQATRQLRDTYPDDPLLWAAHIHVGP